jgi:hypothetical protein
VLPGVVLKKLGRGSVRKLARVVIIIATFALALFLTPKIMLELHLRAARQDGLPIDPTDVKLQLATTEGNNAAPIYLKADDLLQKTLHADKKFAPSLIFFSRFPMPADTSRNDSIIRGYRPVMQIAEVASEKPNIAYARTWSEGVGVVRPEFDSLRDFAILEIKSAGVLASKGDQIGALKAVDAAERISYQSGSEPDFESDLFYCKTQMEINRTVSDLLLHVDRAPAFLNGLEALYSKLPEPRPLSFYCRGQFVMDRLTLEKLPTLTESDYDELLAGLDPDPRERMEKLLKVGYLNAIFEVNFIDYYRNLIASLPKADTDWTALKTAVVAADKSANDDTLQSCATAVFSKPLYVYARSQEGMIASRRLVETALTVLLSKVANGRYPDQLPNAGADSVNPFDGNSFTYSHDEKSFRLSGVDGPGATQALAMTLRPIGDDPPLVKKPRGKIVNAAAKFSAAEAFSRERSKRS